MNDQAAKVQIAKGLVPEGGPGSRCRLTFAATACSSGNPSVLQDTFLADYSRSDRYLPPTKIAASYGSISDYTNQSRRSRLDAAPTESVIYVIPEQQPKRPRPDAMIVQCFPNRYLAHTQTSIIINNNRLPVPHRPASLPLPVTAPTSTPASTASLHPCLIFSITFLFLAFFLLMAYWIGNARM